MGQYKDEKLSTNYEFEFTRTKFSNWNKMLKLGGESDAKILYLDGRASFDISDKSM